MTLRHREYLVEANRREITRKAVAQLASRPVEKKKTYAAQVTGGPAAVRRYERSNLAGYVRKARERDFWEKLLAFMDELGAEKFTVREGGWSYFGFLSVDGPVKKKGGKKADIFLHRGKPVAFKVSGRGEGGSIGHDEDGWFRDKRFGGGGA